MRKALQSQGGDILAICADSVEKLAQSRRQNQNVPCVLASDAGAKAIRTLNLLHESFAKFGKTMPIPANILVDRNGTVVWTHYATLVTDRPDPRFVLEQAKGLATAAQPA